ncbi:hypothetical protein [Natrarchaeobius oligotrophus]|uniref:Right-handed parallel beta-helix repeat-containing protein n=1 Tax=Natrarchaeobius chitinivorans TaxID=1679083 RepID=A0A3N6M4L4_NATCH|nr:hypothetical protein [Natrarchaeobius chitinivorans]RQG98473.1 hypothetical protein EA472_17825 [Natrarchaeobius chitinivorans]
MWELSEFDRLRRRSFVLGSSAAIAGLAGCLDDEPDDSTGNGGGNGDGNGNDDDEGGDDENGESNGGPEPPEPDFVVGSSDEADYETLQEAYDSLESGDVIGLESGRYSVKQSAEYADFEGEILTKTYTYVGASADETVIEIEMPDESSFVVRGNAHFRPEDGAPGFWNATLEIPADLEYTRMGDEGDYEEDEATIDANYCTVNGSFGGPTTAHESVFNDDLSHEIEPVDCRFYGDVSGRSIAGRRCLFYRDLKSRNGYVLDSTIEGTVGLNGVLLRRCELKSGVNVTGSGALEDCVIESKPDSDLAIDIRSAYDAHVTGCEIYGTVRSNQDGSYIDRFELNRFESSARYIVNGAPATSIYLNAFVGGDVSISTDTGDLASFPVDELELYDPERELGNYYSEWEEVHDADEGVLGARTLPGEDGVMDRHPLANPDVEAYAEAAEEADDD